MYSKYKVNMIIFPLYMNFYFSYEAIIMQFKCFFNIKDIVFFVYEAYLKRIMKNKIVMRKNLQFRCRWFEWKKTWRPFFPSWG